jgi:hypothetical protein
VAQTEILLALFYLLSIPLLTWVLRYAFLSRFFSLNLALVQESNKTYRQNNDKDTDGDVSYLLESHDVIVIHRKARFKL